MTKLAPKEVVRTCWKGLIRFSFPEELGFSESRQRERQQWGQVLEDPKSIGPKSRSLAGTLQGKSDCFRATGKSTWRTAWPSWSMVQHSRISQLIAFFFLLFDVRTWHVEVIWGISCLWDLSCQMPWSFSMAPKTGHLYLSLLWLLVSLLRPLSTLGPSLQTPLPLPRSLPSPDKDSFLSG